MTDRLAVFPCGCRPPGHQAGCGEGWDRIPDAPTQALVPDDPEADRARTLDAQLRELETSQVPQVGSAHVPPATNGAPEE